MVSSVRSRLEVHELYGHVENLIEIFTKWDSMQTVPAELKNMANHITEVAKKVIEGVDQVLSKGWSLEEVHGQECVIQGYQTSLISLYPNKLNLYRRNKEFRIYTEKHIVDSATGAFLRAKNKVEEALRTLDKLRNVTSTEPVVVESRFCCVLQ